MRPKPYDADGPSVHVHAHVFGKEGPAWETLAPQVLVSLDNPPRYGQKKSPSQIRCGLSEDIRGIGYKNAVPCGRGNVDVVHPYPKIRHNF
jgi:hypothetical protein